MVWASKPGRRDLSNHCTTMQLATTPLEIEATYNEQCYDLILSYPNKQMKGNRKQKAVKLTASKME